MWTACVAKAAAVWAGAYICAGWMVLPTAAWAGAFPGPTTADRQQSETDDDAVSLPTYGTMEPTPELEPFGATSERTREGTWFMHEFWNSGNPKDTSHLTTGRGVLPGRDDSGEPPQDRRKQDHDGEPDYTIRDNQKQVEGDATGLMQGSSTRQEGWFAKAKREFSALHGKGESSRAALLLRDHLRNINDARLHEVIQAHLPDIMETVGVEASGVHGEPEVTAAEWVRSVLVELARLAGLSSPDRETLLTPTSGSSSSSLASMVAKAGGTMEYPYGIFHAAHVWPDGTWSTREDLCRAGRFDLLPQHSADEEDHDGDEADEDLTSLFQQGDRAHTWEDLMEQLGRWFESGLAVDLALAMLRRRVEERADQAYLRWVAGPLHTIGAGMEVGSMASSETTPPVFYRWSQRVEAHLYSGFRRDQSGSDDEHSLMERSRTGRRRGRRSHTPRRDRERERGWDREALRRDRGVRVTEEVRHLGGGRSSGSGGEATRGWFSEGSRGERRGTWQWCPRDEADTRASKRANRGDREPVQEQASGSTDPAPAAPADTVPVINEAAGIPDLQQPMLPSQAVEMWRYLLFARDAFTNPRGAVPDSWLPLPMLRDIQVHMEAMSEHNLAMMTTGLVSMIRFLMAELSQTMDFAQAIVNTQVHGEAPVDLEDNQEPEPEMEGDGSSMMQAFFESSGKDTMPRRWARAMLRLHKELESQPKAMRTRSIATLRSCIPAHMPQGEATTWQAQLQALLVAVQEDSQDAEGELAVPQGWVQSWVAELGDFIPGFRLRQPPQPLDTVPDQDIDDLVREEAEEAAWREAENRRDEEEEARREAHEHLCEQEARHLLEEAAAYKCWERAVEQESLKRAAQGMETSESKRQCCLSVEVASSSSDRPRILHTLSFDVPTDGTALTFSFRANMQSAPSEISTVPAVDSQGHGQIEEPSAAQSGGQIGQAPSSGMPDSLAVARDSVPELLQLMEFEEYALLYDRWRRGELTQQQVEQMYGTEAMELMLAQEAVGAAADDEGHGGSGEVALTEQDTRTLSAEEDRRGMCRNADGVWQRIPFGRFEVIYGQWKAGYRTDEQISICYGDVWLALFRQWKVWGLDGIWPYLYRVLDALEDCVVPSAVGREFMPPERLPLPLKVPWSTVKVFYLCWKQGSLADRDVVERFGEIWLVLFQKIAQLGVSGARGDLAFYVDWDIPDVQQSIGPATKNDEDRSRGPP